MRGYHFRHSNRFDHLVCLFSLNVSKAPHAFALSVSVSVFMTSTHLLLCLLSVLLVHTHMSVALCWCGVSQQHPPEDRSWVCSPLHYDSESHHVSDEERDTVSVCVPVETRQKTNKNLQIVFNFFYLLLLLH